MFIRSGRRIRRSAFNRVLTAVATTLLLVATGGPALAAGHLGQSVDDHVMLFFEALGSTGLCSAYNGGQTLYVERVMPDGTASHFVVPKGKRLVVTDFEVRVKPGEVLSRGGVITSTLAIMNAANPQAGHRVHTSDFHLTEDHAGATLTIEGQSLAGLILGSDSMLCPYVSVAEGASWAKTLPIEGGAFRGYLVDLTIVPILKPPVEFDREG